MIVSPQGKIARVHLTPRYDSTVSFCLPLSHGASRDTYAWAWVEIDYVILKTVKGSGMRMPGSCAFMNVSNTVAIEPFEINALKIWFAQFV